MKKIINILGLLSFFALIMCVMTVSASAAESSQSEEDWDTVVSFDDETNTNKYFAFYFFSNRTSRRTDKLEYSWAVKDGVITRTGNIDPVKGNVNIAAMTYMEEAYKDFELSVDFKMGTLTNSWPVVAFRQEDPGKYYQASGTGLFMNLDGKINAWGPITDGRIERDIPNKEAYAARDWHNMRILAVGNSVTVYIDDVEVTKLTVSDTKYAKGYISLLSENNDCSFDNFKIKGLDAPEVEQVRTVKNEPNKSQYAGLGQDLDDIIKNGYKGAKIPEAKVTKSVEADDASRSVKEPAPVAKTVNVNTVETNEAEIKTVNHSSGLVEKCNLEFEQKMLVKTFDERKRIFA